MRDTAIVLALVLGFALLVTTHVAIVVGLARRTPRSRAFAAFFVPPLAPYWGLSEKMRVRSILWLVSAAVYGVAWILAAGG